MRREYIYFPCDFYEWGKTDRLRRAHGKNVLLNVLNLWFNSATLEDFDGVYHGMDLEEVGRLAFYEGLDVPPTKTEERWAVEALLEHGFLSKDECGELILVDWDRIANGREEK